MKNRIRFSMILYLALAAWLSLAPLLAQTTTRRPGQSATLLPNGSWLLVGGEEQGLPLPTAAILNPLTKAVKALPNQLQDARAWHTATLLPDGTVLVLGGVGADGQITDTAELFHPDTQRFEVIPSPGFTPRAYHTATVLTEGRVLIAGGISNEDETLGGAQLWDSRAGGAITLPSEFGTRRRNHTANLLQDGRVLLWGGVAEDGTALKDGELFDPQSQTFTPTQTSPDQSETPGSASRVVASIPEDGAPNVPLDTLIALRFSEPLRNATVNSQTVRLLGPEGIVETTVIPAEGGLLAFVTPKKLLSAFALYTVKTSGLIAVDDLSVPESELSFTTGNQVAHGEGWIPPAGGDWQTGRADSVWRSLPPLHAGVGVTALSGQVLRLNGMPLANVTLTVDSVAAKTDRTGRFLLSPLAAGHHEMLIDGGTASQREKAYGFFEVGVDVAGGRTNALPYTIWMPRLDMAHAVTIPSPTTTETVITTPLLPGLELHLPAQTVIRDYEGNVVTKISITPIPLDRPPFPLPTGVDVPIYFTIQPGASYVQVLSDNGPKGARLVYPNSFNAPVKATFDFWNYDPDEKGWYVYGHGRVAAGGKQITPDPGVVIYEFTGAMVASPGLGPASGPAPGNPSGAGGDPIDLGTGLFVLTKTDLFLPDTLPIRLTRTYRQSDNISRAFGIGATHPYDIFLVGNTNPYTYADLILPDGGRIHYVRTSSGTGYADAVYQHTSTPTTFYGSTITWNGNGWTLKTKYGTVYTFPVGDGASRAQQAALTSISDRFGNAVSLTRDGAANLTRITSPNGRWIQLTYDASNRVTQAQDNSGRIVRYVYDASGRLSTVTDPNNGVTTYTYDASNEMLTIKDARQITYLTNQYDANGRVMKQTLVDNSTYQFAYTLDGNGNVIQTNMTDQLGIVRQVTFNSSAYVLTDTYASGKPEQELFTYSRQAATNLVTSVTDPLNRQTSYTYDAMGNMTGVTKLAGTPNAVTTSLAYQVVDPFNQLISVTDPLGHKATLTYQSSNGALLSVTDPLSNKTTFAPNQAGQTVTVTDPLGNQVTFGYNGGDLLDIYDPLNHDTRRILDSAGRLVSVTQPGGDNDLTVYNYDGLNQLTRVTDPVNGLTQFAFDPNGNLQSVMDARNVGATTYIYDNMDRRTKRTDPLLRFETLQYDAAGNVTQFTDRKGQVTTYAYDSLNRLTFVGFGTQPGPTYSSTINYTYDAGNRVTGVLDSLAGTITPTYDDLDRLTGETTPQGSVTYAYDTAGRRTRMTVAGQPAVNYTYDNDNRLTQITQGTATASFAYDTASRRTSMTLPNGVVTTYSYDAASELTGLTYMLGSTTLGALTYSYDAKGQRTAVGGSYARTGLPLAVSSATYDAANELTRWGSGNLTYDANGNLTNDGPNTYTWDARNQLASISASGSTIGAFGYDGLGRRMTKTVGGTSTSFLYDGVNPVQELSGTTPTANLLTGLRVDEVFSRTDSVGARNFLAGALGSTAALTDSTGTVQTQYTYEPFGNTSFSGPASNNSFQFTGRENDGTGVYFYRARYYSPQFGRFISEDPLEFDGGDFDLYGYVGDGPADYIDPWGLYPDDYNLDTRSHGAPHIDRVDKNGKLVGRYREDGSGITHMRKTPPPIPNRDRDKFQKAADELRKKTKDMTKTKCETANPVPQLPPTPSLPCIPSNNCYSVPDGYPGPFVLPLPAPGAPVIIPGLPGFPILPEPGIPILPEPILGIG